MISDYEYIMRISPYLDRFHKGKGNSTFHFRCPHCGDSATDRYKTRGNLYDYEGSTLFKCYNCNHAESFQKFLDFMSEDIGQEYRMERFLNNNGRKAVFKDSNAFAQSEKKSILSDFSKASELPPSHGARKYLKSRMIDDIDDIYYCDDATEFLKRYAQEETGDNTPKLVFPLITKEGYEFGVQFRSLDSSAKLRYRTCIINPKYNKIWGMHAASVPDGVINKDTLYVLEGTIDAKMLDNAVAGLDASLHTIAKKMDFNKDHTVLVFDNEPRNWAVTKNIESAIRDGWKIALWSKSNKSKDLNEARVKGEALPFLKDRIFQGPRALLELSNWKAT